jgi:ATP-dependent Clp protease ATP-binding subunit ClpC
LDKKAISSIVEIELQKLLNRVEKLGYKAILTKAAKNFIVEKGYDTKYGARPLKRALQKYVEDLIAEQIVNNSINDGDSLTIDHLNNNEELTISEITALSS